MGTKTKYFNKHEKIITEGELTHEAYIIMDGEVLVSTERMGDIAVLREGEIFGEIGWLDRLPRTATVRAKSNRVTVNVLDGADAITLSRDNPKAMIPILKILSKRLRDTLRMVDDIIGEKQS
tara:strand:- start:1744 stop:2109 length:366 start_codon:yes stop_codon:yes gene_type:complete